MAVEKLTSQTFEQFIQSGTAVVDFYADWCGPCRMLAPALEQIADEHPELAVCKVNVDDEPALASAFGIMSIPTFVAIKDGEIKGQLLGVRPKEQLLELLK